MRKMIFAVHDVRVAAFMQPFFMTTRGEALRAFMDVCATPDHAFAKHPADYSLWELGSYDEETGQFTNLDAPSPIAKAIDLLAGSAEKEIVR